MPFKVWVPGERVDADALQENIQDQVVAVFASTAARDAAITSPAEGMTCKVTGDDREYTYTGSAWTITGWHAAAGRVGGSWSRGAAQSIPDAANTNVSWDTEAFDSGGFLAHHATTGTTFTVPSGSGGVYGWGVALVMAASPTIGVLRVMRNTSEVLAATNIDAFAAFSVGGTVPLGAGDTIVSVVYQDSAGAINLNSGTFHIYRIGL